MCERQKHQQTNWLEIIKKIVKNTKFCKMITQYAYIILILFHWKSTDNNKSLSNLSLTGHTW